jgi:hypothetical protein
MGCPFSIVFWAMVCLSLIVTILEPMILGVKKCKETSETLYISSPKINSEPWKNVLSSSH